MKNRISEHVTLKRKDIKPNSKNWRYHNKKQLKQLRAVIDTVGFVDEVLVIKDTENVGKYILIDGEARWSITNDEEDIPVGVLDLSPEEADIVLATLDPLSSFAGAEGQRDANISKQKLTELVNANNIDNTRIKGLLDDIQNKYGADEKSTILKKGVTELIPDLPSDANDVYVEKGDLWALGEHKLFCGDSTNPDDVLKLTDGKTVDLVLTDPPYAIYGSSTGLSQDITDDKIVRPFFRDVLSVCEQVCAMYSRIYIFCDWRSYPSWWEMAKQVKIVSKNLIVWYKGGGGLGANYTNTYELVYFASKLPPQKVMGQRKAGQKPVHKPNHITELRATGSDREHNAAKPVNLLKQLIDNSTDSGDTVLDLFMGSGSTLIACEEKNRKAVGMEIDPKYMQVTLERYKRLTGKEPKLIKNYGKTDKDK